MELHSENVDAVKAEVEATQQGLPVAQHSSVSAWSTTMAEREQEHRHRIQAKLIDAQILDKKQARAERRLRQIFGFSGVALLIVAGSTAAVLGESIVGGLFGLAGIVGLIYMFALDHKEPHVNSS